MSVRVIQKDVREGLRDIEDNSVHCVVTSPPYAAATSGHKAREEITKLLKRFGCSQVGFMDEFEKGSVLLAFTHRDRNIQMRASAQGWCDLFLRDNPWTNRRTRTKGEYELDALEQGMIACNSILRDWVKGQITAIECGLVKFEHVFLPYMLTAGGKTVAEKMGPKLLQEAIGE